MTFIDATEIEEASNGDEALALYLSHPLAGDRIVMHDPACPVTRDMGWRCRCTPVTLTIGAKA